MIREYRDDDKAELLANVRPADQDECDALFGEGQLSDALDKSIAGSVLLWTYTYKDQVAAIFGVCPAAGLLGRDGLPWLVGTPLIDKSRGIFMRLAPPMISKMEQVYPRLVNVVDVRNVKSIAWLKRMGFTLLDPINVGPNHMPFHPFFKDIEN